VAAVTLREWTVTVVLQSPLLIARSTGSRDSAAMGEIGRSKGEVVGSVIVRLVFGCSIPGELWRCTLSISDSTLVALVEAPVSLVFSSVSSTRRGSSEAYQRKGLETGQERIRGLTLTFASPTGST